MSNQKKFDILIFSFVAYIIISVGAMACIYLYKDTQNMENEYIIQQIEKERINTLDENWTLHQIMLEQSGQNERAPF